jgi:putative tryptophan/tyrosine transport system substrate-binding protein
VLDLFSPAAMTQRAPSCEPARSSSSRSGRDRRGADGAWSNRRRHPSDPRAGRCCAIHVPPLDKGRAPKVHHSAAAHLSNPRSDQEPWKRRWGLGVAGPSAQPRRTPTTDCSSIPSLRTYELIIIPQDSTALAFGDRTCLPWRGPPAWRRSALTPSRPNGMMPPRKGPLMDRRRGRLSRRQFMAGAGISAGALLAGCGRLPGQGPPAKMPRIGVLLGSSSPQGGAAATETSAVAGLQQGLRDLGYIEGQHLLIDWRYTEGQAPSVQQHTAELVALPVDVLLTAGLPTAGAAHAATNTIPIVMVYPGDPVAAGLVASLARPGGNVTGLTEFQEQLAAKRLELLKIAVPSIARVAVPQDPVGEQLEASVRLGDSMRVAAQTLAVELVPLEVRLPSDLDPALRAATQAGANAVCWVGGRGFRHPEFGARLVALAAQYRLPTIGGFKEWAQAGVLMVYAPNNYDQWRRAAYYVDRLLKGAKPADLPVEQPMTFDFVVNLKTAQALGITVPHEILLQVTEVIQ